MKTTASIEPLESRIAPATLTFTDVDGDRFTIATSKGTNAELTAILTFTAVNLGVQLQEIDFSANAAVFAGTHLTITAKRGPDGGDGRVNVGYIDAEGTADGTALDLGAVKILGDLGRINAGDATTATLAVKGLSVQSIGQFGTSTQGAGGNLESGITGGLGFLKVAGDVKEAQLVVDPGGSGAVTIGGSLRAGDNGAGGTIRCLGAMGPVKIRGDIIGGSAVKSGMISAGTTLAGVTVGGSLLGGSNTESGEIFSNGAMGPVKIGGNVEGGGGPSSGSIRTNSMLAALTIGGSLVGSVGNNSAEIFTFGAIGPVKIGGNIEGGGGISSGSVGTNSTLAALTIGGSLLGGSAGTSGLIATFGAIGPVKIGGNIEGGGDMSGIIFSSTALARVTVGGSLLGGSGDRSGEIASGGAIGPVKIGGNIEGASTAGPGTLERTGFIFGQRIASLFVGGSIVAGTASGGGTLINSGAVRAVHDIGPITVKGSLIGNGTEHVLITARGQLAPGATSDVAIKSLTVGGRVEFADILAGYDQSDIPTGVNADAQIGKVVVGDWIASSLVAGAQDDADALFNSTFGDGNDVKIGELTDAAGIISKIASILIKGTALGTLGGGDHFGFVAQQITSFKIGATAFPLIAGAASALDITGYEVGITTDLRVRELAL